MECPKCGFENPDSFKFCGECAHPLMGTKEARSVDTSTESERKHVTIMFSDLSGYTAMTEKFDPEEVKEIMNQIFGEVTISSVWWELDGHTSALLVKVLGSDYLIISLLCYVQIVSYVNYKSDLVFGRAGQVVYTNQMNPLIDF